MQSLMLLAALVCADPVTAPDGSILVLMDSDKLVNQATGSRISHVGLIVTVKNTPMVYEATPAQVRRLPLAQYRRELAAVNRNRARPIRLFVMTPERELTAAETAKLHEYLDSQLGRRYSVRGYFRERPGDGVHCAALASLALAHCGFVQLPESFRYDPAAFVVSVRTHYDGPTYQPLPAALPQRESWGVRTWEWCDQWRKWCAWSFVESIRFCF